LGGLDIDHVTEFQSFQDCKWHVCRKFSMMSRGIATQVLIQLRLDLEKYENIGKVLEEYLDTSSGIDPSLQYESNERLEGQSESSECDENDGFSGLVQD
jgi:hypothetical protein